MIEHKITSYLNEASGTYKLKDNVYVSSDDFWYDLTDGGYLKPNEVLANGNDVREVMKAIEIVKKFKRTCEEHIPDFVR